MKGLITKHRCNFYQRIMRLDSFWRVYAPRMRRSPPRTACHMNGVGTGVQVNLQVNLFKAIAGGAAPAAPRRSAGHPVCNVFGPNCYKQ